MEFINELITKRANDDDLDTELNNLKTGKTGIGAGSVILIIISILIFLMYCASCIILCCMIGKFKKFRETHLVDVDEQGNAIISSTYQNTQGQYIQNYQRSDPETMNLQSPECVIIVDKPNNPPQGTLNNNYEINNLTYSI